MTSHLSFLSIERIPSNQSADDVSVLFIYLEQSTSGFPSPTNVQLRRISPSALEVTWDPPLYTGILGYLIYYDMYPEKDIDQWQIVTVGPYTTGEITDLEPHSDYAVRVRAKIGENKYSNFSETVVTNRVEHGK